MTTVLHAPSPPCAQPGPTPDKLHHRRSSAALHHRTMSYLSTSTSSSSLHSLAASPSKPRLEGAGPPVRRQLHFGTRPSPSRRRPGGRISSSSTSSEDELGSSSPRASNTAAPRRPAYRLDTTSLPPSRIPVMSPSYRSPSTHIARPAWGVSPTKRSTSFSFNRPPTSSAKPVQPIFVPSPSSPLRPTGSRGNSLFSPTTALAAIDPPISPASPSPYTSHLPPARPLETGRAPARLTPGSTVSSGGRKDRSPLTWHLREGGNDSPSVRRESASSSSRILADNDKLHSPFQSLSEGRSKAARNTPPPAYILSPQPQSQPPKPQPLQRIRGSFPSATSLASSAGSKPCVSPAGSTDSRASSSKLAFEDARPSPEAFKVSLMKKGQGSMHGLARSGSTGTYQAPPTPNPKMSYRPVPHACADRSPHMHMSPSLSTIPRPARSFLSHSLSCHRPPTSSLARPRPPLAASWSAGSESSVAASNHSPAVSPRHKGGENLASHGKNSKPLIPRAGGKAASMAKIQAQSDFLLAVDASMAESPERVNGLGLGLGLGFGLGLGGGSGFPGFERAVMASTGHKSSRSRSRRSGGIKRKGTHLDAPSIPAVSAFADPSDSAPVTSSPPSFSVARQGGRPPLKRASYAEDVFGSKFEVLGEVGRGMSGGVVYKALEKQSGVVAAVKVSPVYGGVRDRIRHLEEVDILRTLSKAPHASVITLLSSWEQAGRLHIQTPLATGGDLASFLSLLADAPSPPSFSASIGEGSSPGLDEGRTWKLLDALASGLAHVHKLGIIHLDIKPANVLITHDRNVILTDFGTATCWPRKRPSEILRGSGMGTAVADEITSGPVWEEREGDRGYLSAEAVNGVVSTAGDVFSLGLLLLEALTNIIPPSNGDAWTRLRTDDFSDIEAPPPSPALSSASTFNSTFSPQLLDSAFSTRSCSSYLGVHSPLTESDTSLLTPFGGLTPGGSATSSWGSDSLTTLVKQLMASDPARRPSAEEIGSHPIIIRARELSASAPLVTEGPAFLGQILAAAGSWSRPSLLAPSFFAPPPSLKDSTFDLARDLEKMDVDVDLSA